MRVVIACCVASMLISIANAYPMIGPRRPEPPKPPIHRPIMGPVINGRH